MGGLIDHEEEELIPLIEHPIEAIKSTYIPKHFHAAEKVKK